MNVIGVNEELFPAEAGSGAAGSPVRLAPTAWPWPCGEGARTCWQHWAMSTGQWCERHGVAPREAVVLLPVGALLPAARRAWAEVVGGWMPQFETVPTLARALAWARPQRQPAQAEQDDLGPPPTLDLVVDRLLVNQALQRQGWGRQWAGRDRRGFEHAVAQMVDCAHQWVRVAQSVAPEERAAYWERCRGTLNASPAGPGSRERLLLAWALEWAAAADDGRWETDALFEHRAAAWVGVTAGAVVVPGSESSIMLAVLQRTHARGVPSLWWDAQAVPPRQEGALQGPSVLRCRDFEDEAQCAAAQVLRAVPAAREGGEPVALVALDRVLVRRIRALLQGAGASVVDETGWKLSTTRAGAAITRLIEAARPSASTDDWLDWLKSGWVRFASLGDPQAQAKAVDMLEAWCRRHGLLVAWGLGDDSGAQDDVEGGDGKHADELVPGGRGGMPQEARLLWQQAAQVLATLRGLWQGQRAPLAVCLQLLQEALRACGTWAALEGDPAGDAVLRSLRLSGDEDPGREWCSLLGDVRMDGGALGQWVAQVLEDSSFRPPGPNEDEAKVDVVVTPLTRAVLRGFSAVVMPGADERQLGASSTLPGWLGAAQAEAMGLPHKRLLREAQWLSFTLLMAQPQVVCLAREAEGREPVEVSPWLERWSLWAGRAWAEADDARSAVSLPPQPVARPAPRLREPGEALRLPLPDKITATSYEALRDCPYRFFGQHILGLREVDELEEGVDRSAFGVWLHAVLQRFHELRAEGGAPVPERDLLHWAQAGRQVTAELGLDRDSRRPFFLPFAATAERLGQHYVQWLHAHEQEGWRLAASEEVVQVPLVLEGEGSHAIRLHGQLDRLDVRTGAGAAREDRHWSVIDYKTGSQERLRQKVRQPAEDTQLAFYAALAQRASSTVRADDGQALASIEQAIYLHMDDKGVTPIRHGDVAESAEMLVEGVRQDLGRILGGEALPALGEGTACEFCAMRGLCRRDHWALGEGEQA